MGHDNDALRKCFDHGRVMGQGVLRSRVRPSTAAGKFEATTPTSPPTRAQLPEGEKRFYLQVGFKAVHYPFQRLAGTKVGTTNQGAFPRRCR